MEFQQTKDGVTFGVWVVPRGRRDEIIGPHGEDLKVRVTAPPVGGRANQALVRFLAGELGITSRQIEVVRGHTSRRKRLCVRGLTVEELRARLLKLERS